MKSFGLAKRDANNFQDFVATNGYKDNKILSIRLHLIVLNNFDKLYKNQ